MNAETYVATLEDHLLEFFHGRGCTHLFQDSAPCHKARMTTVFLADQVIDVIKWPGNSPDLNPTQSLWTVFKNKLEEKRCTSVAMMKEEIKRIWCLDIILQDSDTKYAEKDSGCFGSQWWTYQELKGGSDRR